MESDGIVMNIDEKYLEETNIQVLERHKEKTKEQVFVRTWPDNLSQVFPKVATYGTSGDLKKRLIDKAACIMAFIPWVQAFDDGNRRTSIIAAGTFLRDNGYDLDITTDNENKELIDLLGEIKKFRSDLKADLMKKLILYISQRIIIHEQRT